MRHSFGLAVILLASVSASAQSAGDTLSGTWQAYPAFTEVTAVASGLGRVWAGTTGGVFSYDPATGERRAQIVDFASGREALPPLAPGTDRIAGSVVAETVWAGTTEGALLRSSGEGWATVDIEGRDPSFY